MFYQACIPRPSHRRPSWNNCIRSYRHRRRNSPTTPYFVTCETYLLLFSYLVLTRYFHRAEKPLKIITGRGTHSANKVGVLKPAVKSALIRDGWSVGAWDGGLIVHGRAAGVS